MRFLKTKVNLILSSTSSGLLFSSVNHTLIYKNFSLYVFKGFVKFLIIGQMICLEQIYVIPLYPVDNHY